MYGQVNTKKDLTMSSKKGEIKQKVELEYVVYVKSITFTLESKVSTKSCFIMRQLLSVLCFQFIRKFPLVFAERCIPSIYASVSCESTVIWSFQWHHIGYLKYWTIKRQHCQLVNMDTYSNQYHSNTSRCMLRAFWTGTIIIPSSSLCRRFALFFYNKSLGLLLFTNLMQSHVCSSSLIKNASVWP